MEKEDLIDLIKTLGLTTYEAKAYTALLLYGSLTSTEIASKSEIPQPRVYDVIKGLMEKGLVVINEGRPKKFVALNPEFALKNYIEKKFEMESNAYSKIIDNIKSKFSIKEEGILVTSSNSGINSMIHQSIKDAEYELLVATSSEVLEHTYGSLIQTQVSTCLVIYDENEEIIKKLEGKVDELRLRPTKGPFLFIPDLKYVLAIVRLGTPYPIAYKIIDEHLKTLFIEYFLGYVRRNSLLLSSRLSDKKEGIYVNLVRATDHMKILMNSGHKVKLNIEGRKVGSKEEIALEGTPVSFIEDPIKSIASLHILTSSGEKLSIGGLNAYIEDIEAKKIIIKSQD